MPEYCKDLVPDEGIRFSEAFDVYFRASTPNWREVLARLNDAETGLGTEEGNHRYHKIAEEWLGLRGEAEHRFRSSAFR